MFHYLFRTVLGDDIEMIEVDELERLLQDPQFVDFDDYPEKTATPIEPQKSKSEDKIPGTVANNQNLTESDAGRIGGEGDVCAAAFKMNQSNGFDIA